MTNQLKNLGIFKNVDDERIESVYEDGDKVIEITLFTEDEESDIICIPTYYYRYKKEDNLEEIPISNLYEAIIKSVCKVSYEGGTGTIEEKDLVRRTAKRNLAILFENDDAAPSVKVIKEVHEKERKLKDLLGYNTVSYGIPKQTDKDKEDIKEKVKEEIANIQVKNYTAQKKAMDLSLLIKSKYTKLEEEEKEKLKKWKLEHQIYEKNRKNYLSWDEYFMAIAQLSAMRSKDPSTQVGACIVSNDNRILSIGYNGAPNGFRDVAFPWEREGDELYTKYFYVCHAEMNAILNYRGSKKDLENAKIYVDLFPCNECAKLIIQSGIKEVIYLSDKYNGTDSNLASKHLFDVCGVKYKKLQLKESHTIEITLGEGKLNKKGN